ncbi:MAG: hypothetical protein RL768_2945, partial [Nitrospirota bacterium]
SSVPAAELDRRGITNLDSLARVVPQLIVGTASGSVQGGIITIRGIAGPEANPFGDQAVSLSIDGVQIAKASVRRMSDMDIQQVDVLKGPQALFFGKNSPAGIIIIQTADPTPSLAAGLTTSYEFNARELRAEGYLSGPVSDTLGIRVAGFYSRMQGYFTENTPASSIYDNRYGRLPHSRDYAVRGTVRWEPTDRFDARLKLNYGQTKNSGAGSTAQLISCPAGASQTGIPGQCKPGKRVSNASSGPVVGTLPATLNAFGDGQPFQNQRQFLGGLEMNYRPTDEITLTSMTGYYSAKLGNCNNYGLSEFVLIPSCNPYVNKEFSQEIRAVSDYDGPVNFSGGLYYSDTRAGTGSLTYGFGGYAQIFPSGALFPGSPATGGPNDPVQLNNYYLKQHGKTYSAYLQMIFKPADTIEIDVGGRYSREIKRLTSVRNDPLSGTLTSADELAVSPRRVAFNDFSPEVTISYRPTAQLTAFASYKRGFLSGGFNSGSTAFFNGVDLSYKPQTIKGFEGGIKAETADGALRADFSAYVYKVQDLQVTGFTGVVSVINNAGATSIKGAEASFSYRTPLEGLNLTGAVSYNRGRYTDFSAAPCYAGQTIALGCTINAAGAATQDLSGTELMRAPKWNLSGGLNFERQVSTRIKLGMSVNVDYRSSYLTDVTSDPDGRMPRHALVDASMRVSDADDHWVVGFVGRNLTNKYYFNNSNNIPFTGSGAGSAVGVLGDRYAPINRGRELTIRLSYKY